METVDCHIDERMFELTESSCVSTPLNQHLRHQLVFEFDAGEDVPAVFSAYSSQTRILLNATNMIEQCGREDLSWDPRDEMTRIAEHVW